MAAGLGFKTFTTGEVLTAADTNGYLMQGVLVFASAAARDAAITSPQEGQFAYLKDTNVTTYYTGSAWTNLDTTGMTNPMTTTGDMVYSSSGSTPARLGIGTTGQVLSVAGGIPSWATASSGGMTLLSTTTLSGANTTISSISQSYNKLLIYIYGSTSSADYQPRITPNNTGSICTVTGTTYNSSLGAPTVYRINQGDLIPEPTFLAANTANAITCQIDNYSSTTAFKSVLYYGGGLRYNSDRETFSTAGLIRTTTAISSLVIGTSGGGSFSAGTVLVYGVK